MQEFFFEYISHWSYAGLFVVLFAAGLGLPLPEDIPLLAAGWLAKENPDEVSLGLMIFTGLFGVLVGDCLMFHMGRRYGPQIVEHRWFRRLLKPWLLLKARERFERHGAKIIFAARFMPGLRPVMFATAGMFRVRYWKFLVFDGTAAMISVPLWVWAGYYFPQHLKRIIPGAQMATYTIVGVIGTVFVAFVVWEYIHNYRKRSSNGEAVEPVATKVVDSAPPAEAPHEERAVGAVPRDAVEPLKVKETTTLAE